MMDKNDKNDLPLLHRDDIPMEMAEDLVAKMKELYGDDIKVKFVGDATTKELEALPKEFLEAQKKFYDHTVKCFVQGLCHSCEAKFPGEWPPTDEENWLQGWSYYSIDSEKQPPMLICPKCEDEESDGVPRPMEIGD